MGLFFYEITSFNGNKNLKKLHFLLGLENNNIYKFYWEKKNNKSYKFWWERENLKNNAI